MIDAYGREKMQVMVSNLNNQFFGKVNSLETAKFVSELVGKEDWEMVSASLNRSQSGGSRGAGSRANQSVNCKERSLVRLQDTITLETGEFVGQTVENEQPFFLGKVERRARQVPFAPAGHLRGRSGAGAGRCAGREGATPGVAKSAPRRRPVPSPRTSRSARCKPLFRPTLS